jgi:hypothetical protein
MDQIPNRKHQFTNKLQATISNDQKVNANFFSSEQEPEHAWEDCFCYHGRSSFGLKF